MWRLLAVIAAFWFIFSAVAIVLIAIDVARSLIAVHGQETVLIVAAIGLVVSGGFILIAEFDL